MAATSIGAFPSSALPHHRPALARVSSSRLSIPVISASQASFSQRNLLALHHFPRNGAGNSARFVKPSKCVSLKNEVAGSSSNPSDTETPTVAHQLKEVVDDMEFIEDADFNGKTGFVSFYTGPRGDGRLLTGVKHRSLLWLLGPFVLVASVVLPPYVFRTVFEYLLDDTVVTDFIILFFTEAYFYIGVSAFLFIAHMFRGPIRALESKADDMTAASYTWGYRVCATICTGLSALLAVSCFFVTWKYTGPAAIAALAPYMFGMAVQFCGEKFAADKPAIRPLLPIVFQVYRLHQLNRGAQLVAGLIFSMKTVEASANTIAITGSLQTILSSLQLLGILSLWSLGAFLTQTTLAWHHGKGVSLVPF